MEEAGKIQRAARIVADAKALVFAAGAGMGVDSGLPDFTGPEGFWRAYPPYAKLGLNFYDLANPRWFTSDPALAWGFYGHRLELYRRTLPHAGFAVLLRWAEQSKHGAFVFTSNVDGQFQLAGHPPEQTIECHGSIHHVQCTRECGAGIHPADSIHVQVDPATFRAVGPLALCSGCGALVRPNILMFADAAWDDTRTSTQQTRWVEWLRTAQARDPGAIAVIECGAGTAVPTVRRFTEHLVKTGASLVRINVREPTVPSGQVGLAMGAQAALLAIDNALR